MTPAIEMGALQDAAYGGGTERSGLGDLIGGPQLAAQSDHLSQQRGRGAAGTVPRPRRTIPQAGQAQGAIAAHPLGGGFSADIERGCSRVQPQPIQDDLFS